MMDPVAAGSSSTPSTSSPSIPRPGGRPVSQNMILTLLHLTQFILPSRKAAHPGQGVWNRPLPERLCPHRWGLQRRIVGQIPRNSDPKYLLPDFKSICDISAQMFDPVEETFTEMAATLTGPVRGTLAVQVGRLECYQFEQFIKRFVHRLIPPSGFKMRCPAETTKKQSSVIGSSIILNCHIRVVLHHCSFRSRATAVAKVE